MINKVKSTKILLAFLCIYISILSCANSSSKSAKRRDPYGIEQRERERYAQEEWKQRQFENKLKELAEKERKLKEMDSIKRLPPKVMYYEPYLEYDEGYDEGYDDGYEEGYEDAKEELED